MLNLDMNYKEGKVYMEIKETKCIFKEDTHQYFLVDAKTGEVIKELISVTTLLSKHGLSPDYDGVPSETLKAKAEYGKLVHRELEEYIKDGKIGFTQELQEFMNYCQLNKFEPIDSEFIVYNDIVAGTVDLLGEQNDLDILGDFKTTAILHKETVSWQLSIYAYLYNVQFGCKVDNLKAFHFGNSLKVVDIELKPVEEIEKLFEAESKGELYECKQLQLTEDLKKQLIMAEETIKQIDLQKKEAEANAEKIRQMLLEKMREEGVKSFEDERIKITYIAPTTIETIDSAKLKRELPEIAARYKKISNRKDSVRITLKD